MTMGIGGAAVLAAALTGCSSTENSSTQANSAASASASSSASTSSSGSTGTTTEMAAFEKCMANNGVTMPAHNGRPGDMAPPSGAPAGQPSGAPGQAPAGGSGGSGNTASQQQHTMSAPPGVDETTWTKALAACKSLAPTRQAQPSS